MTSTRGFRDCSVQLLRCRPAAKSSFIARSAQALGRSGVRTQDDFPCADGQDAHSASNSRTEPCMSREQMLPGLANGSVKLVEMVDFVYVGLESNSALAYSSVVVSSAKSGWGCGNESAEDWYA